MSRPRRKSIVPQDPEPALNNKALVSRDVNAFQRAMDAVRLRALGYTWPEIAERAGYASPGAARNAAMREMQRVAVQGVEDLRAQEASLLDQIQRSIAAIAMGDPNAPADADAQDGASSKAGPRKNPNLWAVDRLLQVSRDRRELLGLDIKPEQLAAANGRREYVGVNVEAL